MKSNTFRIALLSGIAFCSLAGASAQTDTAAQDKEFVFKATQGSQDEIAAARMALKKSKNDDVKTFAQKMIDDHTKLIADMKPFADQMGVKPPTTMSPEDKQEAERLKAMTGDKFDKEYVTGMVADHHKDLGEFKHEAETTSNSDLKTTVTSGEAVVKEHTDMIDAMAQKMGIQTPSTPSM